MKEDLLSAGAPAPGLNELLAEPWDLPPEPLRKENLPGIALMLEVAAMVNSRIDNFILMFKKSAIICLFYIGFGN